jgi:hypothetical protein
MTKNRNLDLNPESVVYFIRREVDGLIKIGTTINVKRRMSWLANGAGPTNPQPRRRDMSNDPTIDDLREGAPTKEREMDENVFQRLVSPNGFDGRGPVPEKVTEASKLIARLRVKFVHQWTPGMEHKLTTTELQQLFDAAAVQAEWIRELYEAVHAPTIPTPESKELK